MSVTDVNEEVLLPFEQTLFPPPAWDKIKSKENINKNRSKNTVKYIIYYL